MNDAVLVFEKDGRAYHEAIINLQDDNTFKVRERPW